MDQRSKDLLFESLQLLRSVTEKSFSDWKDRDDWIFSELSFTKSELEEIYKGRGEQIYTGSALDDSSNTKIEYLYRDASNYKVWNTAIIQGRLTDEQIDEIMACLQDGEYFVPSKVGLDEERFGDWTEDDTEYFELCRSGFSITGQKSTVPMRPDELVAKFQAAKGKWLDN